MISSCALLSFTCFGREFNLIPSNSSLASSIYSHKEQVLNKAEGCGTKALECESIPKGTPSQGVRPPQTQHVSQYPAQDKSHSSYTINANPPKRPSKQRNRKTSVSASNSPHPSALTSPPKRRSPLLPQPLKPSPCRHNTSPHPSPPSSPQTPS